MDHKKYRSVVVCLKVRQRLVVLALSKKLSSEIAVNARLSYEDGGQKDAGDIF